ncbi:EF-hand domain-containing protein [Brevundimonas sp. LjRoot202]|uniref:EF-hand domain-containing protein n=1 Tax=Brevundimonas sp. LjRoot202 TaxID=3342281 RepID=UPI003ECFDF4D
MNTTFLAGGLAALALTAAVGGVAVAQQTPEHPHARGMRADADGDHRLSQAEFVGRRVTRLTAADADRDGSVTADERRAAAETRRAGRADSRFDRLDADDDGVISKAEFDSRRDARAGQGPRAARAHRGRRAERMETRGPVVIAEAQARAETAFVRLDADHDGYVTVAERRTARADRREHRLERRAERRGARQAEQASPPAPASE